MGSLKALNLALLSKWWWRLKVNIHSSLWCKVIHSLHGFRRSQPIDPLDSKKNGVWHSIISISKPLQVVNIDVRSLFVRHSRNDHPGSHTAWTWSLNSSGVFTVCSLRKLIDDTILINSNGFQTRWLNSVPSKANIMVWRLMHNRLAPKSNLEKRNITVSNSFCDFCGFRLEREDHLFLSCPLASTE